MRKKGTHKDEHWQKKKQEAEKQKKNTEGNLSVEKGPGPNRLETLKKKAVTEKRVDVQKKEVREGSRVTVGRDKLQKAEERAEK